MSSVDKPVRWVQVCLNAAQRKVSVWPDVPPRCLQTCFPSPRNFRCEAIAVLHSVLCEENKWEINSFFVLLSVVLAACWWFLFLPRRCFGRLRRLTDRKHTYTSVGTLSGTDVRWHRLCPPWGMTSLSPRLCVCVCVCFTVLLSWVWNHVCLYCVSKLCFGVLPCSCRWHKDHCCPLSITTVNGGGGTFSLWNR